jgi:hypothetical protein
MNGPRADPAAPTGKPAMPKAATLKAATLKAATPKAVNRSDHPPKPRFALAIGIVGHRLKHWDDAKGTDGRSLRTEHLQKIAADVHLAFKAIKSAAIQAYHDHESLFDDTADAKQHAPELTLVSALADGADTIAAKAALGLGYALDAPLPFAEAEYENDFGSDAADQPTPLQDFRALVEKARSVLQLPGQRRTTVDTKEQGDLKENRAYEAVGLTVLSQADILLAVWDGKLSRGRGGTAEMVAEAARAGIPIVLIDANAIKPIELRWRGLMPTPAPIVAFDDLPSATLNESIYRVLDELVRPPSAPEERKSLALWFNEISRRVNIRIGYPLLTTVLFARSIRFSDIVPRRASELAEDYVRDAAPVVEPNRPQDIAWLSEAYGWADAIGIHFAQIFRSAFVMNFMFAALAVVAASASIFMTLEDSWWKRAPVKIEIVLIICVVLNTIFAYRWRWHHRWVEAREVAERLRIALPLWALGLRPAFFPGEEPTSTGWYARALVRAQGLRAGDLNSHGLAAERSVLLRLLTSQCNYNHANAGRMHWMERGLEFVGYSLLGATLAVAFVHLFEVSLAEPPVQNLPVGFLPPREAIIWLSAALPALATASYGIRLIGDFEGVFQRADRTNRQLEQLIAAIQQDPPDFSLMRARARSAADAMLGDVASWRLSAESRGLAVPG